MKRVQVTFHVAFMCLAAMNLVTTNTASGQNFEWSQVGGGTWTIGASWLGGVAPSGTVGDILVRPDFGGTITQMPTTITMDDLTIGADQGRGTLHLSTSQVSLLVANGQVTIESNGALSNTTAGTLVATGGLINNGQFTSSSLGLSVIGGGTFTNNGLISGEARIHVPVTNSGNIEQLGGGQLEFNELVTNQASGLIAARDTDLYFRGGLTNQGALSFGQISVIGSDLFGDVNNTGTVGLSSGTEMSFVGNLVQNGTLNLVGDSRLIVFGDFSGAGGSDGPGSLEVLGTLDLGNSPAEVDFGGAVAVGDGMLVELGGTDSGEFDALISQGEVSISGTLEVTLLDPFTPLDGNSFEIISADGGLLGAFSNEILPVLDLGLFWDIDQDATTFTLNVVDHIPGDLNGDGIVTGADVNAFVQALTDRDEYDLNNYPTNTDAAGDVNGDGFFNLGDVAAFKLLVANGGAPASGAAVPEPTSFALSILLIVSLVTLRPKKGDKSH